MSKSFMIFALIALLVLTGCTSQAQFLASKQPTAIQAAATRGQFEMNLSERYRRGAFARGHTTGHPGPT